MKRFAFAVVCATSLSVAIAWAITHTPWMMGAPFTLRGDKYAFDAPTMFYGLLALPWLLVAQSVSLVNAGFFKRVAQFTLRALAMAAAITALAHPVRTTDTHEVETLLLVDVSDSMSDAALREANALAADLWQHREGAKLHVVRFASRAERVAIEASAEAPATIARFASPADNRATNIVRAMDLGMSLFSVGTLHRVLVFSDGLETHDRVDASLARFSRMGTRIAFRAPTAPIENDVAITNLSVPQKLRVGSVFKVHATLRATRPAHVRVKLLRDGSPNTPQSAHEFDLPAGESLVDFESLVEVAGNVRYEARLEQSAPDRFVDNDAFPLGVFVPGRPVVLFVDSESSRATALPRALVAGQFDVELRGPREFPTSLQELERFEFVVLSDVSAAELSLGAQDLIERYVRQSGGGFMMSGGTQSFGLGGWQGAPLERILPIRMDPERRRDEPSLALALVIDKSGSMQGLKIELAKEAAKATAQVLGEEDFLSVVGFDTTPHRIVRMQSASNRVQILNDISRLNADGGTAITPALETAFQDLAAIRARYKHVILLTDGITREPSLEPLVRAMRADGITVTTVGLGNDVQRALLQSLADAGGGRAYFTNDPHSVPRIFVNEATTVQRSSAVDEYARAVRVGNADFLRGFDLDAAPYLHGYVATRIKPAPAQEILRTDLGEPLLARMRVGLGWSLAWTSDVKNRWATEWLRWPGFQPFWTQLVREHMRHVERDTLPIETEIRGDSLHIKLEATRGDDRFLNGLTSHVVLEGPLAGRDQSPARLEADLRQTAPGRYETDVPMTRFGAYTLQATHRMQDRIYAESSAQIAFPYPLELARLTPDTRALASVAHASGGDAFSDARALLRAGTDRITKTADAWQPLLLVAIVLFVVELALRRVRT